MAGELVRDHDSSCCHVPAMLSVVPHVLSAAVDTWLDWDGYREVIVCKANERRQSNYHQYLELHVCPARGAQIAWKTLVS